MSPRLYRAAYHLGSRIDPRSSHVHPTACASLVGIFAWRELPTVEVDEYEGQVGSVDLMLRVVVFGELAVRYGS